jgi:hypothetical protein
LVFFITDFVFGGFLLLTARTGLATRAAGFHLQAAGAARKVEGSEDEGTDDENVAVASQFWNDVDDGRYCISVFDYLVTQEVTISMKHLIFATLHN